MERYTSMYPRGQQGLPDDPVTVYMNDLRATRATSGSATTRRTPSTRPRDPTRECFICVVSASSSSTNPEPAPHHRATDSLRVSTTIGHDNHDRPDENRARHHDDRGRGRHYNSGDDRDRS
jgi:hypothetical protein